MKAHWLILLSILFFSCSQSKKHPGQSNDDSVFVLLHQIDSIKHSYAVIEKDYLVLYNIADRIKPYCDSFRGADKSKLPGIYNFCAEMYRRRNYEKDHDNLVDCCHKALSISRSLKDTLGVNYTNSLHFLADAYSRSGKLDESLKLRFELLSIYEKIYPEWTDSPQYIKYDIGKTYELKGDITRANEYFNKVLAYQEHAGSKFLTEPINNIKAFQKKYKQTLK